MRSLLNSNSLSQLSWTMICVDNQSRNTSLASLSSLWEPDSKERKADCEETWWERESTFLLGQSLLQIQIFNLTNLEFRWILLPIWHIQKLWLLTTTTRWRNSSKMVLRIGLEPNLSSDTTTGKSTSQLSKTDQTLTLRSATKSKDTWKMATTSFSIASLLCTKCQSWATEWKSFLIRLSEWIWAWPHHTMLTSMATKWTCMFLKATRQLQKSKRSCWFRSRWWIRNPTNQSWESCKTRFWVACSLPREILSSTMKI